MLNSFLTTFAFIITLSLISPIQTSTKKPVIGIVTTPSDFHEHYNPNEYSYMKHSYAEFIEEGGGKPVVIPWDTPEDQLMLILNSVNGVVFTGGDANLTVNDSITGEPVLSGYTIRAKQIVDYAIKLNNEGKVFPILGVCQGPQVVLMAISEDPNVIVGFDHRKTYDYLYFDGEGRRSRMFSYYSEHLFDFLEKNKAMYFEHSLGFKPSAIKENDKLKEMFNVLALGRDEDDQEFVAALEGKEYPFYLVQYHPEFVFQDYMDKGKQEKKDDNYQSIYHLARFFVDETKKSDHVFDREDECLKKFRVENGERVYVNQQFFDVYFYKKQGMYPEETSFEDFMRNQN